MQADDADRVARLVSALAFTAYQRGMVATAERWFRWIEDHGDVEDYPAVAVLAAMIAALTGKPADTERWARAAEQGAVVASLPDRSASLEPWLALLRALLCRDGVAQMQADAELATATMAAGSFWRSAATVYLGMAHLMADDSDQADVLFAAGIAEGLASGVTVGPCVALGEQSLLAITNGEWDSGERYLDQARMLARDANLEDHPPFAILYAAAARIALHQGDRLRAREELARAQRLRPTLTYAMPHLAVQARLELGACHLALPDPAAARALLREIDEILIRRPGLGVLSAKPSSCGPSSRKCAAQNSRCVGTHCRRTATPALALHPSIVPGARRGNVPVSQHHQVPGVLDPASRSLQPQPQSCNPAS